MIMVMVMYAILLKARIMEHLLQQQDGVSEHQFCFMKERLTKQAIERVMGIGEGPGYIVNYITASYAHWYRWMWQTPLTLPPGKK